MNRIKELRKERDLTQKELGKLIGKSNHTINKWETDINDIPSEQLNKLCDIFGCTIDYLLCRTDTNTASVELTGMQIPLNLREAGLHHVKLLREYIDSNGGILPEVQQELLLLLGKAALLQESSSQSIQFLRSRKKK
jgi:transcriptional regulator with XRE-family HTH domain